jgi:hypothetical protein
MLQDPQFANDVQELIQAKQKKSAFVYVRNHLTLIEQALDEGARIVDIYELLTKNGVSITLPTLRLYLHRLRTANKTEKSTKLISNKNKSSQNNGFQAINSSFMQHEDQLDIINDNQINNGEVPSIRNIQSIKNQTPNLEELSKAFKFKG